MLIDVGQVYREEFVYTQQEVNEFARITGDTNPIHIDAAYAATTQFKKPIMHGILGAGVISRVMGTKFPGEGGIYLKQDLVFKRPMYVEVKYEVVVTVKEVNRDKHTAIIETNIIDKETGKACVGGEAHIMHKERI